MEALRMNKNTRTEIMAKFREEVANGKILLGVGAGTGITAKSSEAGGADMLIVYNSGRYRMARPWITGRVIILWGCQPNCSRNGLGSIACC